MIRLRHSHHGFTLVELIVGMTVFAIGLSGIYVLISSVMGNAAYSRHEVVVANLLREQLELVRNVRDTNLQNYIPWDSAKFDSSSQTWFAPGMYIIENDFTTDVVEINNSNGTIKQSPVRIKKITTLPSSPTSKDYFDNSRLYLDEQWRYTHTNTASGTLYASYILVTPIGYSDALWYQKIEKDSKSQWYIIDARVIVWAGRGYREYDAKTMITDWVR